VLIADEPEEVDCDVELENGMHMKFKQSRENLDDWLSREANGKDAHSENNESGRLWYTKPQYKWNKIA